METEKQNFRTVYYKPLFISLVLRVSTLLFNKPSKFSRTETIFYDGQKETANCRIHRVDKKGEKIAYVQNHGHNFFNMKKTLFTFRIVSLSKFSGIDKQTNKT